MSLFEITMRGDWDAVLGEYRGEARKQKIIVTGDTTMHLAIRFGKTRHIREMLGKIGEDEAFEILSIKNDRGNTALHVAAELGNPAVCHCIAKQDLRLLSLRNHDGATPLYVSVANGHRNAFFTLDSLVENSRQQSGNAVNYYLYKNNTGYTILHMAVFREYFGFAVQIVDAYPDLVDLADNSGSTPLHILARKREAFENPSLTGFHNSIMLPWINVEQLVTKEQERPVICNIVEPENSGSHQTNSPRTNSTNTPTQSSINEGNGSINPYFGGLFMQILALIKHIALSQLRVAIGMAGLQLPGTLNLILYVSQWRKSLREMELRRRMACVLLNKLVDQSSMYRNDPSLVHCNLSIISVLQETVGKNQLDTPFLIAARNGVIEVVKVILKKFPIAAFDVDSELKNAAMLAAERKQVELIEFLLEQHPEKMNGMLLQLDKQGNSMLHHCATFQDPTLSTYTPRPTSLLAVHYSRFEFLKSKMPPEFSHLRNSCGFTPEEVFMKTHKELIKSGSEWLVKTSESCSVVAALITTVAFNTSAVDPPAPDLSQQMFIGFPLFNLYSVLAFVALCFAVISLFYFLSIRTSSFRVQHFAEFLPLKLFLGLLFLLLSVIFMFASFCIRQYTKLSNLHERTRTSVLICYAVSGMLVASLAASLLPFHGTVFEFRLPVKQYNCKMPYPKLFFDWLRSSPTRSKNNNAGED